MYHPSSCSSSHCHSGLTRYGSAPGSLLTSDADTVMGFSSSSSKSTTTCKVNSSSHPIPKEEQLQRSYGLQEAGDGISFGRSSSSSALLRQRSSPAGFLPHLPTTPHPNEGFSITRGTGSYSSHGVSNGGHGVSRLKPQLSFTGQESLSQISEYSLPQTTLELATMEKLLHIPEDSVPCKIGAKRGCATHPRSIAERERRTRISGKLKKLQDLVPNMDKQTSYADMLDLAVEHIKGLQSQVQKLNKELEHCSCGCKPST